MNSCNAISFQINKEVEFAAYFLYDRKSRGVFYSFPVSDEAAKSFASNFARKPVQLGFDFWPRMGSAWVPGSP